MHITKKLSNTVVKSVNEATGIVEGYASTFGNIDSYNDTIRQGAFRESLESLFHNDAIIPVLFEHKQDLNSHIGEIVEAKEDATGLYVKAKLDLDTESGRRAFNLIKGRRIKGMSIGFYPQSVSSGSIDGQPVNVIESVDLKEISLVMNPADSHALVTSVKSAAQRYSFDEFAHELKEVVYEGRREPSRLLIRRNELSHEVKERIEKHGEYMTSDTYADVMKSIEQIKKYDARIAKGDAMAKNMDALLSLEYDEDRPSHTLGNQRHIYRKNNTMSQRLATKSQERLHIAADLANDLRLKEGTTATAGVATIGQVIAPVAQGDGILPLERAPLNLLSAIPTSVTESPAFSYLRQTLRELNANVVGVGEEKPKSQLGFERVDTSLEVVAHIVREIDEYILRDMAGLQSFIANEMIAGVFEKVEALIVEALNTADGAQLQAFNTDAMTTARLAKAKLQSVGLEPAFYAINHDDWALMETTKAAGSGNFLFNSAPVDTTNGTLWGVPVLPTIHAAPGSAKLIATESAALFTDGEVRIAVNASQSDFEHNQVSFRAEGRFKPVTLRSMGIVEVELTQP